jgi:hypothetical protein
MAKGKQDSKAADKGSGGAKGKKADKGGASDDKAIAGKVKGAQSINVRHILVSLQRGSHTAVR